MINMSYMLYRAVTNSKKRQFLIQYNDKYNYIYNYQTRVGTFLTYNSAGKA